MIETMQHPIYGEIAYNESFWTGKKSLTFNGVEAQKIDKKTFKIGEKLVDVKGNFTLGVKLLIDGETIEVSPAPKWYETVLAILPIVFALTWGNSVALCQIFPIMGGAIGGALGALFSMLSLSFMKKEKRVAVKVIIGLAMFAVSVLAGNRIAVAFILALS
ncbi:MAG: hypothetical protein IKB66_02365 [Clostridia bacterium]|nr:hypothetical protein [Clostridia bacterium]MBR2496072.1 hypothetical protein [Clostridia bacterium]